MWEGVRLPRSLLLMRLLLLLLLRCGKGRWLEQQGPRNDKGTGGNKLNREGPAATAAFAADDDAAAAESAGATDQDSAGYR